jgi:hypothetical protein
MMGMMVVVIIALVAAASLGYQIGFRRGMGHAVRCAEDQAIVTAITRIVTNKSEHHTSPHPKTRGIYSLRK